MVDLESPEIQKAFNLIRSPKGPCEKQGRYEINFDKLYESIVSSILVERGNYCCSIYDKNMDIYYYLNVFISPIPSKFSVSLRFKKDYIHLIRFDFGKNVRHTNNYNTKDKKEITGPHVHIMSPCRKTDQKDVIKIDENNFSQFDGLVKLADVFVEAVKYVNINKGNEGGVDEK